MPITINGSGTIDGYTVGTGSLAENSVTLGKLGTTEQGQLCKAWVNFNGNGTVEVRASFNVSSITDNGVGWYGVNFINAMPDTNYAVITTGQLQLNAVNYSDTTQPYAYATTSVDVVSGFYLEVPGNAQRDHAYYHVAIFR